MMTIYQQSLQILKDPVSNAIIYTFKEIQYPVSVQCGAFLTCSLLVVMGCSWHTIWRRYFSDKAGSESGFPSDTTKRFVCTHFLIISRQVCAFLSVYMYKWSPFSERERERERECVCVCVFRYLVVICTSVNFMLSIM